jgi:hypothetical protein
MSPSIGLMGVWSSLPSLIERHRRFLFWLLLLAALGFRLFRLNAYSIWLDEAWQYGSSDHPLDRVKSDTGFPVDQMFLSMLVTNLHILTHFDADAWQLRMSPVIFGVAAVATIFFLAREMFDERTAWVATCLATVWPRLIQYSQEMRAYSLFVLLATTAAFALLRALRTNSLKYWVLFSASVILELYNHFMAATNALALGLFTAGWVAVTLIRTYFPSPAPYTRRALLARLGLAAAGFAAIGLGLLPVLQFYIRFQNFVSRQGYRGGSPLRLTPDNLQTIFGFDIGLGIGTSVYIIGACAIIGFVYACVRFPRAAALCFFWIGLPIFLAMMRKGGEGILGSTRYLQFVTPAYLSLIAAGIVGVSDGVEQLIRRLLSYRPEMPKPSIPLVALTIVLLTLCVAPLRLLYGNNPKEVAVDLRSAYDYVLSRATPNDVVLGFGEVTFWHSGWFRATDAYYFHKKPGIVREVVTLGTMNYAPIPFRDIDRATGRLFCMVPTRGSLQPTIHEVAGDNYETTCWERICVLESRAQLSAADLFDDFCVRFSFMDPEGLARVRREHEQARANTN